MPGWQRVVEALGVALGDTALPVAADAMTTTHSVIDALFRCLSKLKGTHLHDIDNRQEMPLDDRQTDLASFSFVPKTAFHTLRPPGPRPYILQRLF
jgi:hypothetical protein